MRPPLSLSKGRGPSADCFPTMGPAASPLTKVTHEVRMMSLDNAFADEDVATLASTVAEAVTKAASVKNPWLI